MQRSQWAVISSATVPGAPAHSEPMYKLSDYLEQVGRKERASLFPQPYFAHIALQNITDIEQLRAMASSMEERGRHFYAAQLYLRASDLGDHESAHKLADILEFSGDGAGAVEVIEASYQSGDPDGSKLYAYYLYRNGEKGKAEELCLNEFSKGNSKPWIELREAYELAGDTAEYEKLEDRLISRKFPEIGAVVKSVNFDRARGVAISGIAKRLTVSEREAESLFEEELEYATPGLS